MGTAGITQKPFSFQHQYKKPVFLRFSGLFDRLTSAFFLSH
ncbi:hypothetical protein NBRC3257_0386 [Gluconobacter thailandicus NBRC 3257]|uniref:Transposase n=1 Tax=Gluconobacter thailandicus NBRC 3257 TaxID=1381097 RepID=A0ABQ0IT59_GLUTH|nr:hypothetical protein NBRC3255_1313 [Gluconobacter thailandicus NBRC 3255]GAD25387.1 hypothetical protein NBRC3257_0386 [Gluconobacter thailandicus NBRC 3257]